MNAVDDLRRTCRSIRSSAPGARNAVVSLPAHSAAREGHADHRPRLPGDRRRAGRANWNARGLNYNAFVLEDLAPRPLPNMPRAGARRHGDQRRQHLRGEGAGNELRTRMQMTDVVNRRKMRHAHMVNIDRRIMLEGMRADFDEVDRISTQVWQMASAAREIRATNPAGTDIVGTFSPDLKWLKTSGIISPQQVGQSARRRDLHHAGARGRTSS